VVESASKPTCREARARRRRTCSWSAEKASKACRASRPDGREPVMSAAVRSKLVVSAIPCADQGDVCSAELEDTLASVKLACGSSAALGVVAIAVLASTLDESSVISGPNPCQLANWVICVFTRVCLPVVSSTSSLLLRVKGDLPGGGFRVVLSVLSQSYQYVIGISPGLQLLGHALSGMVFGKALLSCSRNSPRLFEWMVRCESECSIFVSRVARE
jgi:hypothetical protein